MSNSEIKRTIPIHKVVAAAMVDMYVDISQAGVQQTMLFNAARGFRKLNNEVLKQGRRKVLLDVNTNTYTAKLPVDFYEESFVGVIDENGNKAPLRMSFNLTDTNNIDEIECDDKCPKCSQDKNICKELSITEDTKIVVINKTPYEQTIIKTLYPNGDYYVETITPVLDTSSTTPETAAIGHIIVTHIGSTGAKVEVTIKGQSLGIYTQGASDTTTDAIAAAAAAYFNGKYGYQFSASGSDITIVAAPGNGSSINGGSNISVVLTQVTFSGGGLGTIRPAIAVTVTQFYGGVNGTGLDGAAVVYVTQKEFISKISLKDCGCIEETQENIDCIKANNYECYCNHFCGTCNDAVDASYEIFTDTSIIKFSNNFKYKKVYLEYQGFLPKKNGVYQVPEICFETLVQWIKWKSVENKKSVSLQERNFVWDHYVIERGNMQKILGRFSLQDIVKSIGLIPKFDYEYFREESCFKQTPINNTVPVNTCNTLSTSIPAVTPSNQTYFPFGILAVAGSNSESPVPGLSYWKDARLKNALLINYIIVNNENESRDSTVSGQSVRDFKIDTVEGILYRFQSDGVTPRNWDAGDTLVIPPFFKMIS